MILKLKIFNKRKNLHIKRKAIKAKQCKMYIILHCFLNVLKKFFPILLGKNTNFAKKFSKFIPKKEIYIVKGEKINENN